MNDFSRIDELLSTEIVAAHFPGAVYLISENNEIKIINALGNAVVIPEVIAATTNTIYDLASLTKPLVTALICVILQEQNGLDFESTAGSYLPEFSAGDKRYITVKQLLTHSSGLPAWRPLYADVNNPDDVLAHIAKVPLENPPETKVVYSDLGFIVLGKLIERITGDSLIDAATREIFAPLGLKDTCFNPPAALLKRIAATENGNQYEEKMAGDMASHYTGWRREMIWGKVHDGNAYFLRGAAGHAGLFGTANDVFKIAQQFLPGSDLLSNGSLAQFSTNFTAGCGIDRSIGWSLATNTNGAAGNKISRTAFGHSGFTGTSTWIDPEKNRVFILLTNRVHPHRSDFDMDELRRQFHNLAVDLLDANLATDAVS
jgi:CubicO group peptidase (beta-lactamase class C family)